MHAIIKCKVYRAVKRKLDYYRFQAIDVCYLQLGGEKSYRTLDYCHLNRFLGNFIRFGHLYHSAANEINFHKRCFVDNEPYSIDVIIIY